MAMAQASATPNPAASATFKPINSSTTIGAVSGLTTAVSQQSATGGPTPPTGPPQQLTSPTKEVNAASLCRSGQEMVQEVVQKTTDIFKELKCPLLPNGTTVTPQLCQDRRAKLDEHIRSINASFRKLLVIYEKVKEYREDKPIEEYLPIEENGEILGERPRISETLVYISEEHKDIIEQIQLKNQQLKEIIDHLRMVIWEINTMMAVKRC